MTPEPASPRGSDYAALSRLVKQSGLLDRRHGYYAWKVSLTAAALVLGLARAQAVADALKQDGVPDNAVRVNAEASGRGASLRLIQ